MTLAGVFITTVENADRPHLNDVIYSRRISKTALKSLILLADIAYKFVPFLGQFIIYIWLCLRGGKF